MAHKRTRISMHDKRDEACWNPVALHVMRIQVVSARVLREVHRVAEIGVALEELDILDLFRLWTSVAQDVEPIPNIHDVDQPMADDRKAPDDNLVRPAAEGRILQRHRVERLRREESS